MYELFSRSYNLYKYRYEVCLILSLFLLLIIGIYRYFRGYSGTWNNFNKASWIGVDIAIDDTPQSSNQGKESRGEKRTRIYLEKYFNKPFIKARPLFLNNPVTGSNYNLELDCFNEELNLAVEFNGRQHYEYIPFFHKNKEAFYNQKYRDEMKRTKCRDRGIKLVEIPYTEERNLEHFLYKKLKEFGYDI